MRAYARTDVCIVYSVVTKYASPIAHQMQRSQRSLGAHTALQAPMHLIGVLPRDQLSRNQLPLNQLPIDQLSYQVNSH